MGYLGDPREEAIRPESGITLENDNRVEQMWHWGAAVLDLCDLPVEEYMKPMTVIVSGGTEPGPTPPGPTPTGDTYTVSFMYNDEIIHVAYVEKGEKVSNSDIATATNEVQKLIDPWMTFNGWNPDPSVTSITGNTPMNPILVYNEENSVYCGFVNELDEVDLNSLYKMSASTMTGAAGYEFTLTLPISEGYVNEANDMDNLTGDFAGLDPENEDDLVQMANIWDNYVTDSLSARTNAIFFVISKNISDNYNVELKQEYASILDDDETTYEVKGDLIYFKYLPEGTAYVSTNVSPEYKYTVRISKKN